MTHSILRKFMLIAVLLTSSYTFAHDFEVDGIYYNIISASDLTIEVTYQGSSYDTIDNEYTGDVKVPSTVTYNGSTYSVTTIGETAFCYCSSLTSVTIPSSVTSINDYAFCYCNGLTSVTIPNSVASIGDYAFYDCNSLTSLDIPHSITTIGEAAFFKCTNLTKVNITDIEKWCQIKFYSAYANPLYYANKLYLNDELLTNFVVPNSVTSIKLHWDIPRPITLKVMDLQNPQTRVW